MTYLDLPAIEEDHQLFKVAFRSCLEFCTQLGLVARAIRDFRNFVQQFGRVYSFLDRATELAPKVC